MIPFRDGRDQMSNANVQQQKVIEKLLKGLQHQKAGEIEKAQRCYLQALKKAPKHPETLNLLGVTHRQLGFPKRAIDYIQRAIAVNPGEASFYTNLARAEMDDGAGADRLLELCAKALSLDPADREALNIKGIALTRQGGHAEAETLFQTLIAQSPDYIDAYLNYGLLLMQSDRTEDAIALYQKAISVNPRNPNVVVQRARARLALEQYDQSIQELSQALKTFAGNSDITHEAARLMFTKNEPDKGVKLALAAFQGDPKNHQKAITLGATYLQNGQPKEALKTFLQAQKIAPGADKTLDWNLSLAYLANGDLDNGWALHKARFESETTQARARTFDVPAWTGEDIPSKTVLVWSDQGLGDVLRAASMLPDLIARAGKVIVETHEKAVGILQASFPETVCRTINMEKNFRATKSDYDLHTNITDLVDFFRPDVAAFSRARHPVLRFEADRARGYLDRLEGHAEKPVIGLSWRSRNLAAKRARFYLQAADIAPLVASREAIFVNLQYQADDDEIALLRDRIPQSFAVFDDVDLFDDLPGAAALTACCDLVVSANTSVADMAGLLDVPCIRFGQPEPTLLLGQEAPPWYPSMTYLHPYKDRPCSDFVPEIIAEMERRLDDWSPEKRNARLGF